ncbi:VOC domain-containing protein OS=Lysinibacillus sphaericus OX=1421 GN=LS41612_07890 PE=4 SV=1 [Lysinibacillus sphaericus]
MKIFKIKLYAYDLHKMREFYCTLLGFELLDEGTIFLT